MQEKIIKVEAKNIMDNFMKSLSNIDVEEDFNLIREKSFRKENNSYKNQEEIREFKNKFLSNAPKISGDAILANKGEWTKK